MESTYSDWEIRDSISLHSEIDETFKLVVKLARHLGLDTELEEKLFKNAQDFHYQTGAHKPEVKEQK